MFAHLLRVFSPRGRRGVACPRARVLCDPRSSSGEVATRPCVATEVSSPVELKPTMSFHRKSHRDSNFPAATSQQAKAIFFQNGAMGKQVRRLVNIGHVFPNRVGLALSHPCFQNQNIPEKRKVRRVYFNACIGNVSDVVFYF